MTWAIWKEKEQINFYLTRVTKLIRATPGKHIGRLGHQDPGEFPEEVKALFEKAVEYYEENMALMVEIQVSPKDRWSYQIFKFSHI